METTEAREKRHNRACTIKQRKRNYRTEIIRRRIDRRFSITLVKEILRRYGIPFTAINIAKSSIMGEKSLYIGLRNTSNVRQYEVQTRNLFSPDFYNEFRTRHRQWTSRIQHHRFANGELCLNTRQPDSRWNLLFVCYFFISFLFMLFFIRSFILVF